MVSSVEPSLNIEPVCMCVWENSKNGDLSITGCISLPRVLCIVRDGDLCPSFILQVSFLALSIT